MQLTRCLCLGLYRMLSCIGDQIRLLAGCLLQSSQAQISDTRPGPSPPYAMAYLFAVPPR